MQAKRIFTVIAVLFSVGTSVAQRPVVTNNDLKLPERESSFQVNIYADTNPAIFRLLRQNPGKKKLQLQISHDNFGVTVDTIIYCEYFSRRYNLSQADDGRYTIIVSNGKERFSKEVEMNTVTTRNVLIH